MFAHKRKSRGSVFSNNVAPKKRKQGAPHNGVSSSNTTLNGIKHVLTLEKLDKARDNTLKSIGDYISTIDMQMVEDASLFNMLKRWGLPQNTAMISTMKRVIIDLALSVDLYPMDRNIVPSEVVPSGGDLLESLEQRECNYKESYNEDFVTAETEKMGKFIAVNMPELYYSILSSGANNRVTSIMGASKKFGAETTPPNVVCYDKTKNVAKYANKKRRKCTVGDVVSVYMGDSSLHFGSGSVVLRLNALCSASLSKRLKHVEQYAVCKGLADTPGSKTLDLKMNDIFHPSLRPMLVNTRYRKAFFTFVSELLYFMRHIVPRNHFDNGLSKETIINSTKIKDTPSLFGGGEQKYMTIIKALYIIDNNMIDYIQTKYTKNIANKIPKLLSTVNKMLKWVTDIERHKNGKAKALPTEECEEYDLNEPDYPISCGDEAHYVSSEDSDA